VRLLLASTSPRRAELLRAAGFEFDVAPSDVNETPLAGERPREYVLRLALEKVRAARAAPGQVVLGADTTVVIDETILGKPASAEEASAMLCRLAGRVHEVWTGVALRQDAREVSDVGVTRVEFAPMTPAEIAWYVTSGEPEGKAGAYAVQGLASRFVTHLEGSYSNVVGLPVALVYQLLQRLERG
jgi:septum formation protein